MTASMCRGELNPGTSKQPCTHIIKYWYPVETRKKKPDGQATTANFNETTKDGRGEKQPTLQRGGRKKKNINTPQFLQRKRGTSGDYMGKTVKKRCLR